MHSSPVEQPAADLLAVAAVLCGEDILNAQPCGGGGNNRVYRIRTQHGTFALKSYGPADLDDRDRLGHEFDGLRFLKQCGIGRALPAAIAVDRNARCALYEWIDGSIAADHGDEDISAVLDLWKELNSARSAPGAQALPHATEAVLKFSDLLGQIDFRLGRFATACVDELELKSFLQSELQPELERCLTRLSASDMEATLPPDLRTLSPSDFGFHNALRRRDGTLCFIDFEYFGWDDPVKLVSDFLWHPAMELSQRERSRFMDGVNDLFGSDPDFRARLALSFPLYGIRWILIILNEFLPNLWARRSFSGKGGDWDAAKRAQLHKARAKLAALHSYKEGHFGT